MYQRVGKPLTGKRRCDTNGVPDTRRVRRFMLLLGFTVSLSGVSSAAGSEPDINCIGNDGPRLFDDGLPQVPSPGDRPGGSVSAVSHPAVAAQSVAVLPPDLLPARRFLPVGIGERPGHRARVDRPPRFFR